MGPKEGLASAGSRRRMFPLRRSECSVGVYKYEYVDTWFMVHGTWAAERIGASDGVCLYDDGFISRRG